MSQNQGKPLVIVSDASSGMGAATAEVVLKQGLPLPELPFGGVKNSGYGRELAELGIEEFLNKMLVRIKDTH